MKYNFRTKETIDTERQKHEQKRQRRDSAKAKLKEKPKQSLPAVIEQLEAIKTHLGLDEEEE